MLSQPLTFTACLLEHWGGGHGRANAPVLEWVGLTQHAAAPQRGSIMGSPSKLGTHWAKLPPLFSRENQCPYPKVVEKTPNLQTEFVFIPMTFQNADP